jgi:Phosducin.
MRELAELQQKSIHGSVYPISKPEWAREVTEASHQGPVFVNLTSPQGDANPESRVLSALWKQAAREYGEIKFCEIRADRAIENYPERNCPTILVYRNGDIIKQVVTLATVGGVRMTMLDLDKILVEVGAVQEGDLRVVKRRREAEDAEEEKKASGGGSGGLRIGGSRARRGAKDDDDDDDDSDWD